MKYRLQILIALLVVLPTLVLTFLAERSLRYDELAVRRQLELTGTGAVRLVADRVRLRLQDELDQVAGVLMECLAAGGDQDAIRSGVSRLLQARPLVRDVYLFMNPWGFVWPRETAAPEERRADVHLPELLAGALRAALASGAGHRERVPVAVDGRVFFFTPLGGRNVYYAGFELDPEGLDALLASASAEASGSGVIVLAGDPRVIRSGPAPDVTARDSLGERVEVAASPLDDPGRLLALQALPAPLERIVVRSYAQSPMTLERMAGVRRGLYAWGIVLLACGVMGGAWLIAGWAASEVRAAQSRSDMVIGVSHDLRTPLTSIRMLAESLHLGRVADPERQRAFLAIIVQECERMVVLVERVLYLVRYGSGALGLTFSSCDVGALVRECVEGFQARHGAVVSANGKPEAPLFSVRIEEGLPAVPADRGALAQVVLNLLDNAVKYGATSQGEGAGPRVDVEVFGQRRRRPWRGERECVGLRVRDHGRGLGPAERRRLFRKFYRAPQARELNVSGVGLGLSMCRHVVRRHGGWIELATEPGKGCAFTVLLPAGAIQR